MTKFLKRFFAICLCLVIPVMLCSCGDESKHTEHTYSQEWSSNDEQHWHTCTENGCDVIDSKANHTWDNGTVSGHKKVFKCTVCEKTKEEPVPHLPATEWSKNETKHWHACGVDGCEEMLDAGDHSWDNGYIEGHYTVKTCTVCGAENKTKNSCQASTSWEKDLDNHWHTCTIDGCEEKVDKATHDWDIGVDVGHNKLYTCTTCGKEKEVRNPCTYNTADFVTNETHHWYVCSIDGCEEILQKAAHEFDGGQNSRHNIDYTCEICKYTKSERRDCEFATTWTKDAEYHWHVCKISGCTEISNKEEHDWDEGVATADGKLYTCLDCGETKEECEVCVFETKWTKSATHHWHACEKDTCSKVDQKAEHDWTASYIEDHHRIRKCETCGYVESVSLNHEFDSASWSKDSTHHWKVCTIDGCSVIGNKATHDFGTPVLDGHTNVYTCECGQIKEEVADHSYTGAKWESDSNNHWQVCVLGNCTHMGNFGEHNFDDGVVVGHNIVKTCQTCGKEKEFPLEHDFTGVDWTIDEDYHWHVCKYEGCTVTDTKKLHSWSEPEIINHKKVWVCSGCGQSKEENLSHNFVWNENCSDENHWKICTVKDCGEMESFGPHEYGSAVIENHKNVYTCSVCGHSKEELIPHNYENVDWSKDEENHWHVCKFEGCTEVDSKVEHNFNEPVVDGDKTTKVCKTCGYESVVWSNTFIRSLENLAQNSYRIKLTNLKVRLDTYQDIDFAELYLTTDENGNLEGYGFCNMVDPSAEVTLFDLVVIIKDGKVYFANVDNQSEYGGESYMFANVEDLLIALNAVSNNAVPGGLETIMGASVQISEVFSEELAYIYTSLCESYASNREAMNDKLAALVEKFFVYEEVEGVDTYTLDVQGFKDINEYLNTKTLEEVINDIFGDDSYDSLEMFLRNSLEKPLSEWITLLDQNGIKVYDILDYLDVLAGKVYTLMFGELEEGAPAVTLESLIYELSEGETQIPDISEELKKEEYQNISIMDLINLVGQMNTPEDEEFVPIEASDVKDMISGAMGMYGKKTIYENIKEILKLIVNMSMPEMTVPDNLDNNVNAAAASDSNDAVVGVVSVKDMYLNMIDSLDFYGLFNDLLTLVENVSTISYQVAPDGTITYTNITVNVFDKVQGTLEIIPNTTTDVDYEEMIEYFDEMHQFVTSIEIKESDLPTNIEFERTVDSVTGNILVKYSSYSETRSEGYNYINEYSDIFEFTPDGKFVKYHHLYYYLREEISDYYYYRNETDYSYVLEFDNTLPVAVTTDCGDWIQISYLGVNNPYERYENYNGEEEYSYDIPSFNFYYNLQTGEIHVNTIVYHDVYCSFDDDNYTMTETDYGYLVTYKCNDCDKVYYYQLSKYLNDSIANSFEYNYEEIYVKNAIENEQEYYSLDEVYIYDEEFDLYYKYSQDLDKWVSVKINGTVTHEYFLGFGMDSFEMVVITNISA